MGVRRCFGGGRVNLEFGIVAHGLNQVGQFMPAEPWVNARTCDLRTGCHWVCGSA